MKNCPKCGCSFYDNNLEVCVRCQTKLIYTGDDIEQGYASKPFGDNFIDKQIKRTNRNLLLINIGSIAGIILLWLGNLFYGAGYWGLAIFGIIILNIWNIVKFWKRNKNPFIHPINIALAKFGSPQKIAAIINEEIKVPKVEVKPIIVTDSWLLKTSIFGLETILLGELAWIHGKVTTQSTYGIPSGKSYAVIIYTRDGKSFEISCGELASSLLMVRVAESAPWVVRGYGAEIQKLWDTDRVGFIAHVDQRKQEINRGFKDS